MERIELGRDEGLNIGDRVEMHFRSTGMTWLKAAQIAMLESRLEKHPEFTVISIQTPTDEPTILIFVIEVKKTNPLVLTAGAIAMIIAGAAAGVLLSITFISAYKLVRSPIGKVAVAGTGLGIATAGIAALLYFLLPKK